MIYGNHSKKKGDIVQIARWDDDLLYEMSKLYQVEPWKIDEVKFIIVVIDYSRRTIGFIPNNPRISQIIGCVPLDATNLIRVGRLVDKHT